MIFNSNQLHFLDLIVFIFKKLVYFASKTCLLKTEIAITPIFSAQSVFPQIEEVCLKIKAYTCSHHSHCST